MENREGPFIRGHSIYSELYSVAEDLFHSSFNGTSTTYETNDCYGAFWVTHNLDTTRAIELANKIRERINRYVGYSIIAKPESHEAESDSNPYNHNAVCLCLLPKHIADQSDRYGGDAMTAALSACVDSGIIYFQ
jgi:hypothetical protein